MNVEQYIDEPIENWTLERLNEVANGRVQETQRLEFKRDFETAEHERWRTRQDQISTKSRDALAAEIVAFANSFGGVLLLGIAEEKHEDGRRLSVGLGPAIPRVAECAERLESAIRAVVDPPLSAFEVRSVESDDGAGFIVMKVGPSSLAPHGIGRPAAAYVRRSAASEPMTMRDLQHVFWEARTAIDRVEKTFATRHKLFSDLIESRFTGLSSPQPVYYRFTVVPSRSCEITRIPDEVNHRSGFQFRQVPFQGQEPQALTFQAPIWRPVARGVHSKDGPKDLWVWSDGTMELRGAHTAPSIDRPHYPVWYAVSAIWLLFNAVRFRRRVGRVDIPLILEAELRPSQHGEIKFRDDWDEDVLPPVGGPIDRLEIVRDDEFDDLAQLLAEQVGWAFGIDADFSSLRLGPNVKFLCDS